jgi:hypothetical protein
MTLQKLFQNHFPYIFFLSLFITIYLDDAGDTLTTFLINYIYK